MAQPNTNENPRWSAKRTEFSTLSKLVNKDLSMSSMSVPSERPFSDAGNQITAKKNVRSLTD